MTEIDRFHTLMYKPRTFNESGKHCHTGVLTQTKIYFSLHKKVGRTAELQIYVCMCVGEGGSLEIQSKTAVRARFVIWAAGVFGRNNLSGRLLLL